MPPRKVKKRPPRVKYDKQKKKYYVVQNKVKRYIDGSKKDIDKAIQSGDFSYKTGVKKGPTWLGKFPEMAPLNTDSIERRIAEKNRWETYTTAREIYKTLDPVKVEEDIKKVEEKPAAERTAAEDTALDIYKTAKTEVPPQLKTDREKDIYTFLYNMGLDELRKYIVDIGGSAVPHMEITKTILAMLAHPDLSNIIQTAYDEYQQTKQYSEYTGGMTDDNSFYEISKRLKAKGLGFDEDNYSGLYGDEILKIMKPYKGFLGVIMNDEIPEVIEASLHFDRFGFVINKDNHNMEGSHWCAVFVDIPDGSVEYFDSFGDDPSPEVTRDMAELIKEHDINYLMKFKVNGVKVQDLRTGSCGWFAMKFLIDRFNGVPFDKASGFSVVGIGSRKGEGEVSKMKKSFGYI